MKRNAEILPPKFNMMAQMKFDPDKGLGKHSQGRKNPIKAIRVSFKAGLGFKSLLKHQFRKNKKRKVNYKAALRFVSASKLSEPSNTLLTIPPAQTNPSKHSIEHLSIQLVMIPPLAVSQHPAYHLKVAPHVHMSSTKPSVPKVKECSAPNTLEHREDNNSSKSTLTP